MNANPDTLIDALGGTSKVAEIFGIQPPSVSEWRGQGIPEARLQTLRALAMVRKDIAEAMTRAGYAIPSRRTKRVA